MLSDSDISVVMQGPIASGVTGKCLSAIRSLLPHAEIILSTWKGEDVSGISFDCLVQSEDPGAVELNAKTDDRNNINRQLISTQQGLLHVSRKYVLKIRTDLELLSLEFLEYYFRHNISSEVFSERVLILDHFTRNCRIIPVPFSPSDWLMFGRYEDVCQYYAAPLMPLEEMLYFKCHEDRQPLFSAPYHRFVPEQWICLNFLCKKWSIKCSDYHDNTMENRMLTERFLTKSCLVYPYNEKEFLFHKYNPDRFCDRFTLFTQDDWQAIVTGTQIPKVRWRKMLYRCRMKTISLIEWLGIKEFLREIIKRGKIL